MSAGRLGFASTLGSSQQVAGGGSRSVFLDGDLIFEFIARLSRPEQLEFARRIGSSVDVVCLHLFLVYVE